MANPPYSKGITPKDNPAPATPMPLATISASPIRLWFRMIDVGWLYYNIFVYRSYEIFVLHD
jgi:hypothetical protein